MRDRYQEFHHSIFTLKFIKNRFTEVANGKSKNSNYCEVEFHKKMQNPLNGAIEFIGLNRGSLHNGNLDDLKMYFDADGNHIFDVTVEKLVIRDTELKGFNRGIPDQMPDGIQYIANLIAINPCIKVIDLGNTKIGDDEANQLLAALKKNNRLRQLILDGNEISEEVLSKINNEIKLKPYMDVKKYSHILSQGNFSIFPKDIQTCIAAQARDADYLNEKDAIEFINYQLKK